MRTGLHRRVPPTGCISRRAARRHRGAMAEQRDPDGRGHVPGEAASGVSGRRFVIDDDQCYSTGSDPVWQRRRIEGTRSGTRRRSIGYFRGRQSTGGMSYVHSMRGYETRTRGLDTEHIYMRRCALRCAGDEETSLWASEVERRMAASQAGSASGGVTVPRTSTAL